MDFLTSPKARKIASIGLASASVLLLGFVIAKHTVLAEPSLGDLSHLHVAIDGETKKVYEGVYVPEGASLPWKNPETGKDTLYPAETCYWTRDGKAKLDPTFVLLNDFIGKKEKTICPDCGRVVVVHNPMPPMNLMVDAGKAAGKFKDNGK